MAESKAMPPIDRLLELAAEHPDELALVVDGLELTWGELESASGVAARGLAAHGVASGERVVVSVPKSLAQVALLLGAWRLGSVPVPVHPVYTDEQLAAIALDAGARLLLLGRLRGEAWGEREAPCPVAVAEEVASGGTRDATGAEEARDEPGPISGTAADPKATAVLFYDSVDGDFTGFAWSHDDLERSAGALRAPIGAPTGRVDPSVGLPRSKREGIGGRGEPAAVDSSTRFGGLLCLNVPAGLLPLVGALAAGRPLFLHSSVFPKDLFAFLARWEVTHLTVMPITVARMFQERLYVAPPRRLDAVRSIVVAGGVLAPAEHERLRREFPGASLQTAYGGAFGFPIAWRAGAETWRTVPSVEIAIDSGDGALAVRVGEIDRWEGARGGAAPGRSLLRTGDRARAVSGGFDSLARADDRIVTQGYTLYSTEIEQALSPVDGVGSLIVVGVPHAEWGEQVVLVWHPGDPEADGPEADEPDRDEVGRELVRRALAVLPAYARPAERLLAPRPVGSEDRAEWRQRLAARSSDRGVPG